MIFTPFSIVLFKTLGMHPVLYMILLNFLKMFIIHFFLSLIWSAAIITKLFESFHRIRYRLIWNFQSTNKFTLLHTLECLKARSEKKFCSLYSTLECNTRIAFCWETINSKTYFSCKDNKILVMEYFFYYFDLNFTRIISGHPIFMFIIY